VQVMDILGELEQLSRWRASSYSEPQAASGAAALLPALLGGFKGQAQAHPPASRALPDCWAASAAPGLLTTCLARSRTNTSRGDDVLGQIFGRRT